MIIKPENLTFNDKKFSMIIYGPPGIGKTTLALSAPDPVLLDFDRGVSRVRAAHRKATSVCNSYEEVKADVNSPEMAGFQTVIIDTGGSFITFLKDWVMRTKRDAKTKSGDISIRGFGYVKSEFNRFTEDVKTRLNKNIIYVFHSVEQADKDGNPIQRLMCEGATKNTVWTPCDFGGYVQMIGNKRVISFTPEQEFFAKGCHGIVGNREIPALGPNDKNDYIARLFDEAKQNIESENREFAPIREQYEKVMAEARQLIESTTDIETANETARKIAGMEHALTSKREALTLMMEKAKQLGIKYSKADGGYIPAGD